MLLSTCELLHIFNPALHRFIYSYLNLSLTLSSIYTPVRLYTSSIHSDTTALYVFYYVFAFDDISICLFLLHVSLEGLGHSQTPQTASSSKLPYISCTSLCHNVNAILYWWKYCTRTSQPGGWLSPPLTSAKIGMYILKFYIAVFDVPPCIHLKLYKKQQNYKNNIKHFIFAILVAYKKTHTLCLFLSATKKSTFFLGFYFHARQQFHWPFSRRKPPE